MMNKKVRYGIIGFGAFAERSIAQAIQSSPHSELIAIQKRSLETAREKANALNIPLAFDSGEKLANHPEIDAVFVASAVVQHKQDVLAVAKAKKHVIVEKPMAMSAVEAEQIIEACHQAGVKLMVAHMVRFSPLLSRIKELIQSDVIGKVAFVRAEYMYDARFSQRRWLLERKVAGGGASFDIGVHCIDTVRFLLDDEVVSLKSQLFPKPTELEAEKISLLSLKFSKGTVASIYCSFLSPLRRAFLEVVGQKGILSVENFPMSGLSVSLKTVLGNNNLAVETKEETIAIPNLYEKEVTAFSESIIKNSASPIPGEEGLKNQELLDEALKQ